MYVIWQFENLQTLMKSLLFFFIVCIVLVTLEIMRQEHIVFFVLIGFSSHL